jgi:CubicO group peptidase (beta-lactamase class C family)
MAMCSVLLIAALLAACAAPAAAPTAIPAPPTDTPMPPAADSDPVAVVQAWVGAINSGDVDEALSYFTDDGRYLVHYTAYDKESMRWVFNWLASLETKQENLDCQAQDDNTTCTYAVLDGCIAVFDAEGLPVKTTFTVQDGKIKMATGSGTGPKWDGYWDFVSIVQSWERVFRPEEYTQYTQNEGTTEAGKLAVKLCREYESIVKTQEPATAAAAQGLVDAINSGDTNAALALFTQSDETKFRMMSDEVVGADHLGSMFDWLAGKAAQFEIADCEWQGTGTQCAATVIDDCIVASGAGQGLHGKMTFYSEEDGALRHGIFVPTPVERKVYEAWLEAETAWASANRADELAQAEGYSQEAGAMAVRLCQEYAAAPKLDDATVAEIEAAVKQMMDDNQIPGAAVGIVKDGQIVYANGFGVTEAGGDKPVTSRSLFHMASITKSFVATAIMQLVAAGKIDLDAPVTDYLPCFTMADPRYQEVTIRHLLSHTAGMPDVADWVAEFRDKEPTYEDAALREYACSLGDADLLFAPGESWSYSSIGFDVLGAVIAEVSGQGFTDYITENILVPLAMDDTVLMLPDADSGLLASPHMVAEDGSPETMNFFPNSAIHAASGTLLTSADDLMRYAMAHLNRGELDDARILPADAYETMWESYVASPWSELFGPLLTYYGMGWWVGEATGEPTVGAYGADPGFQSHLVILPEQNMAIVDMVNVYDPDTGQFHAFNMGNMIMDMLMND